MNKEKLLQESIENKRVIFVGPSPIMKGKNLGKWIDEFDVVVRTNGAIYLLDRISYQENYGKKCDLLGINVQFHRECKPLDLKGWKKKYGLRFLGMKTRPQNLIEEYSKIIPTFSFADTIGELHKKVEGVLYGPIVMTHLLKYNPKEMWFTGIDFYYTKPDMFIPGDYREYFPDYLPKKIRDKADVKNLGRVDPHNQYSNCKYMWDLMNEGKIQTNDFIKDIMTDIVNNPGYYTPEARKKRVNK